MPDNRFDSRARRDCFKEAVCVNASRVYDACRDRECLEDLRVLFVERDQEIVDNAIAVKLKSAEICNVFIDTEPLPFNRGYYCVELTIYFSVRLDVTVSPMSNACEVCGLCVCTKKAILFGSDGSVRVFSSDYVYDDEDVQNLPGGNLPRVTCQIAEPVCLGAKLENVCEPCCCCVPHSVSRRFGGSFDHAGGERAVLVSIGVFMIIQLERQVQMLMPVYDFCMPEKICVEEGSDDPCEMFSRLSFPADAFFPPKADDCGGCGCDCGGEGHGRSPAYCGEPAPLPSCGCEASRDKVCGR